MKFNVKFLSVVLIVSFLFSFAACGKKIKVDEPVTVDNANMSSVNAASGFIQSVFTDDEELFYKVFPENAFYSYIEEGNDPFEEYKATVDHTFDFYGIDFSGENDFTVENGYDEDWMKISISLAHTVREADITNISLVKLRVYFTNPEKNDQASTDVYIVTYKVDNTWYVFEMANSDADFKA